jgi:hypothetical protein
MDLLNQYRYLGTSIQFGCYSCLKSKIPALRISKYSLNMTQA